MHKREKESKKLTFLCNQNSGIWICIYYSSIQHHRTTLRGHMHWEGATLWNKILTELIFACKLLIKNRSSVFENRYSITKLNIAILDIFNIFLHPQFLIYDSSQSHYISVNVNSMYYLHIIIKKKQKGQATKKVRRYNIQLVLKRLFWMGLNSELRCGAFVLI